MIKQRIIYTFLAASLLLGCSSGNKQVTSTDGASEKNDVSDIENSNNPVEPVNNPIQITEYYADSLSEAQCKYQDDMIWMFLKLSTDRGDSFGYGLVDKKGKLLTTVIKPDHISAFEDGYSTVANEEHSYHINKKGEVTAAIHIDENQEIVCYASGYTVVENHVSGFDSNQYEYLIYGHDGEVIEKYEPGDGEEHDVYYLGKGVFTFRICVDRNWTNDTYFTKTNKWVRRTFETDPYFGNNTEIIIDVSLEDDKGYLISFDENGYLYNRELPYSPRNVFSVRDRSIIVGANCLVVDEGSMYVWYFDRPDYIGIIDEPYYSRVYWNSSAFVFEDETIALPLVGQDGNSYVALFGIDGCIKGEPIQHSGFQYSDGMLTIVNDSDNIEIYDNNGQKVTEIITAKKRHNALNKQKFGDGLYVNGDDSSLNNMKVYDKTGKQVYDKIDITNNHFLEMGVESNTEVLQTVN